jgi:hypothetical protein
VVSAAGQGVADQFTVGGSGGGAVFAGELALEQERHRWVPGPIVVVVGRAQWDGAVFVADPPRWCEYVGQFGADDQEPFGVGFGRRDMQQGDEFAVGRQRVADKAVVGESPSSSIRMPLWRSKLRAGTGGCAS